MKSFWSWLKKHTRAYNVVVIALVFLGLAIVSFIAMALGTRHSARRTVPDFVGLRMNDAEYFAARRDLQIIINDSLHVSAYPGGVILDQLPKGGVVVKPGRKVYVTINSVRQRMVDVPYVAGRSLRQAKNMLETAGLTIDHLEYAEDMATNFLYYVSRAYARELAANHATIPYHKSRCDIPLRSAPQSAKIATEHLLHPETNIRYAHAIRNQSPEQHANLYWSR